MLDCYRAYQGLGVHIIDPLGPQPETAWTLHPACVAGSKRPSRQTSAKPTTPDPRSRV